MHVWYAQNAIMGIRTAIARFLMSNGRLIKTACLACRKLVNPLQAYKHLKQGVVIINVTNGAIHGEPRSPRLNARCTVLFPPRCILKPSSLFVINTLG